VSGYPAPDVIWYEPGERLPPAANRHRGIGGHLRALVHAGAFLGLLLAGAVLLALTVGPVVEGVAILLHFFGHMGGELNVGQNGTDVLGLLICLACYWTVLPAGLLAARRLAIHTSRLSARWCGVPIRQAYAPRPAGRRPGTTRLTYRQRMNWLLSDPATWRDQAWLAVNAVAGLALLLVPLLLVCLGIVLFIIPGINAFPGFAEGAVPRPAFPGNTPPVLFLIGVAMVTAGTLVAPVVLRGYAGLARWVLAPSTQAELQLRVAHLAKTRTETLDTGAAELRRIERDLHDGAQARLVAMGLTLDAAGRLIDDDPAAARALLYEARDASVKALAELRDLVRGIHPPVLADRGLADAIRALALDSPLPVDVTGALLGRPPAPVESGAYFAVSELLANAAKHSGAESATIDLRHESGALRISVRDNGRGGAIPSDGTRLGDPGGGTGPRDSGGGTGLRGIERRLAAFDGVLVVTSPPGGPTEAVLEVPCALS
jgi:signal transduction histidine kinase